MSDNNQRIHDLLSRYFEARHFQMIPTDTETVKMYAVFQKSSLYLINVISLDSYYAIDNERYQKYKDFTRKQFESIPSDNTILLNIIITEDVEHMVAGVDKPPNLEDNFIDINWVIDSKNKELIIPPHQLNKILDLQKTIHELLENGTGKFYEVPILHENYYMTLFFIAVNVVMFFVLEYFGGSLNTAVLMQFGAMQASRIVETGEYWRLFTSMYLHIGLAHLFFNSFSLFLFGSRLEKYINSWQFLLIYIGSGLIGSSISFAGSIMTNPSVVAAGASGAIYGLIGSIIVLSRAAEKPIEGLSSYTMWLIFLIGIIYSLVSPHVDAFAHIGGFVGGILISMPIIASHKRMGGSGDERG